MCCCAVLLLLLLLFVAVTVSQPSITVDKNNVKDGESVVFTCTVDNFNDDISVMQEGTSRAFCFSSSPCTPTDNTLYTAVKSGTTDVIFTILSFLKARDVGSWIVRYGTSTDSNPITLAAFIDSTSSSGGVSGGKIAAIVCGIFILIIIVSVTILLVLIYCTDILVPTGRRIIAFNVEEAMVVLEWKAPNMCGIKGYIVEILCDDKPFETKEVSANQLQCNFIVDRRSQNVCCRVQARFACFVSKPLEEQKQFVFDESLH